MRQKILVRDTESKNKQTKKTRERIYVIMCQNNIPKLDRRKTKDLFLESNKLLSEKDL